MHYLLFYEVAEDYVARRAEFRDAHLEKAWQASERGELLLGGALSNPIDGAVFLFHGDSPEVAEKFARADPYVSSGAVKRWHVREWMTVAGEAAATPIRPNAVAGPRQRVACLRTRRMRAFRPETKTKTKARSCECGRRERRSRDPVNTWNTQPKRYSRHSMRSMDIAEHTCSNVRSTMRLNLSS